LTEVKVAIEKPEFAAPEVRAAARRRFVLGGGTFFLLGMGCMAVLQGLGPASSPKRATASASITTRQQNQSPSTLATAEPMGAGFEYSSLPLHEPDELLTDTSRPLSSPRWYFGNCSSEQLTALIDSLGLRAQDKAALLEPSRWQASGNGFYLTPPPALVLEIATLKVRQGSGTVQLAASLPVSDTALRLFWANANVETRIVTTTATVI